MVQATDEDEPAAPAVGDDGDVHAGQERSRRFPFDRSLLTALVDRWRPEPEKKARALLLGGDRPKLVEGICSLR